MKNNNKNSILDWEKLMSQPPLVQAISILSLVILVAMFFTMRQYIVTVTWFTYVGLVGGICLVLGMFLYAYKGRFQTFGKYFFGFVLIVYAALIVTVYAGIGSEREWNDLEVESYYVHSTSGIKLKGPSYLVVSIDDQPVHIYPVAGNADQTLRIRFQRLRHRRPDSPPDCPTLLRDAKGQNRTESRQRLIWISSYLEKNLLFYVCLPSSVLWSKHLIVFPD